MEEKMNILIVSQYFYPEEFKINDLAKEFIRRGHKVSVLTGKPNYPKGEYYEGYSFRGLVKEDYYGAEVIRVPLIKRKSGGAFRLLLNYLSFVYYANKYLKRNRIDADLILCYEISPITQAYPAIYCKKKYGGKVALWVQDLWPESVTAAGGVHNKYALRILDRMVRKIYDGCDKLLVQSNGFRESILSKGNYSSKIEYVPNWAEDLYLKKELINESEISELMPPGFRVMFAGNIGVAQNIDAIIRAAFETRKIEEIKWIFVGDGRARAYAEKLAKELGLERTVYFLGRHPMEEMPTFFSFADAMIVSLKDDYIFSLTIPAKTQSYMASGKPIVAMLDGEGRRVIEDAGCGLTAAAGDYNRLANNVMELYKMSSEERAVIGNKGKEYYLRHFDKEAIVDSILKVSQT